MVSILCICNRTLKLRHFSCTCAAAAVVAAASVKATADVVACSVTSTADVVATLAKHFYFY
jgi:hypothetical protein